MLEIADYVQGEYALLLERLGLTYREVNGFVHSAWAAISFGLSLVCSALYVRYRREFDARLRAFFFWVSIAFFLEGSLTLILVLYLAKSYSEGVVQISSTSAYFPIAVVFTFAISAAFFLAIRTHIVGAYGRSVLWAAVAFVLLVGFGTARFFELNLLAVVAGF